MRYERYEKDSGRWILVEEVFTLDYTYESCPDAGFSFPCDRHGQPDPGMTPEAKANYGACLLGEVNGSRVISRGVQKVIYKTMCCSCGSRHLPDKLFDARGIYVGRVCPECEEITRSKYRAEIFSDPNYEADDLGDED